MPYSSFSSTPTAHRELSERPAEARQREGPPPAAGALPYLCVRSRRLLVATEPVSYRAGAGRVVLLLPPSAEPAVSTTGPASSLAGDGRSTVGAGAGADTSGEIDPSTGVDLVTVSVTFLVSFRETRWPASFAKPASPLWASVPQALEMPRPPPNAPPLLPHAVIATATGTLKLLPLPLPVLSPLVWLAPEPASLEPLVPQAFEMPRPPPEPPAPLPQAVPEPANGELQLLPLPIPVLSPVFCVPPDPEFIAAVPQAPEMPPPAPAPPPPLPQAVPATAIGALTLLPLPIPVLSPVVWSAA